MLLLNQTIYFLINQTCVYFRKVVSKIESYYMKLMQLQNSLFQASSTTCTTKGSFFFFLLTYQ